MVDVWAAQHADEGTKPVALTFALIGLYLHVERGFTGREVQRVHMRLGGGKHEWPRFVLPLERGSVTAAHVMAAPAGAERDRVIDEWCKTVWGAFEGSRQLVAELLSRHGIA